MSRLLVFTLFAVWSATLCLASPVARAENKVALVIGNSAYEHLKNLTHPAGDAAAVARMLEEIGFEVISGRNLENKEFRRAIRDFSVKARDAQMGIVFVAGHAVQVKGTNYLIPADAKLISESDIRDEAIPLDRVLESLDSVKRLRLVLLDVSGDTPFRDSSFQKRNGAGITPGLAEIGLGVENMLVSYAAKPGSAVDVTPVPDKTHSPFTAAILKHLPSPGVDIRIALGRLREEVLQDTGGRQQPYTYGSLRGPEISIVSSAPKSRNNRLPVGVCDRADGRLDLCYSDEARDEFRKNLLREFEGRSPEMMRRIEESNQERAVWDSIKTSEDPAVFRQFIQRFPNGPRALEAHRRLELLETAARQRKVDEERMHEQQGKTSKQRSNRTRRTQNIPKHKIVPSEICDGAEACYSAEYLDRLRKSRQP